MNNKILLHCCCAPCTTSAWDQLKADWDITLFWFNPNIYPQLEHNKRLDEMIKFAKKVNLPLVISDNTIDFYEETAGLENELEGGKRCVRCFEIRLQTTAEFAKKNGFDFYATTLTVSPYKNADLINSIGKENEKENVNYLETNFKKNGGYQKSIELCKEYNIYRQKYCGCKFSRRPNGI